MKDLYVCVREREHPRSRYGAFTGCCCTLSYPQFHICALVPLGSFWIVTLPLDSTRWRSNVAGPPWITGPLSSL